MQRLRNWFEKTMRSRLIKAIVTIIIATGLTSALAWSVFQGYSIEWTGFGGFTTSKGEYIRGKTLWDWMELFIIPIFLAIGAFFLNRSERKSERQRAEERANLERRIATDRQQEAALQSYLDRMADLLLKDKLRTSKKMELRDVARIRTLSVLRGLDKRRKGLVLLFLKEAGLVSARKPIINLTDADLRGVELIGANLMDVNLIGANLDNAFLFSCFFNKAQLSQINLINANLSNAVLTGADVSNRRLLRQHRQNFVDKTTRQGQ